MSWRMNLRYVVNCIKCVNMLFLYTVELTSEFLCALQKYLDHIVPLVIAGMRNFEATSLCKVAIGTLVDISVNVSGEILRFCDQIMATLMECLKDNSVDRSIKPVVISCLGDIALAIAGAFEPYLQVTTMLLMQAAQQQAPPEDEDMIIFINELRFAVLEAYSGILLGLDDGNKLHLFLPNVQNVMPFLQYLSAPMSNRDAGVLHKSVTLLGDIARVLGTQEVVRSMLNQPFVIQLLTECSEMGGDEGRKTATWAHEQVQHALLG
jgi:importin subunit beta-1